MRRRTYTPPVEEEKPKVKKKKEAFDGDHTEKKPTVKSDNE